MNTEMGISSDVEVLRNDEKINSSKQSILLVDDDEVTLGIMKAYLHKFYTVTAVSNGRHALEFLSMRSVDLVLLDYMMPEMDGPTVFRRIKEDFPEPHVPIIFLTSVSEKELVYKGLQLRPSDYLLKPVNQSDLLERVNKVLMK